MLATRRARHRALTGTTRNRVLVLGGTSEIALAIVQELSALGECEAILAGRDIERLELTANQLGEAGCPLVETLQIDAHRPEDHREALARGFQMLGGIDLVILAVGILGDRDVRSTEIEAAVEVLNVNGVGAGSMLLHSARAMQEQGYGTIVVLSSVAAERPRGSNAVYCASKAGLDWLAQGVGDALAASEVRVLVVRPGFVETRMTKGLPLPPLSSDPRSVARATVGGLRRDARTVWVPGSLRWVMMVLRHLPRPVFERLPL